jgi:hypothetical protein
VHLYSYQEYEKLKDRLYSSQRCFIAYPVNHGSRCSTVTYLNLALTKHLDHDRKVHRIVHTERNLYFHRLSVASTFIFESLSLNPFLDPIPTLRDVSPAKRDTVSRYHSLHLHIRAA